VDAGVVGRRVEPHELHGGPVLLPLGRVQREPGEAPQLLGETGVHRGRLGAVVGADRSSRPPAAAVGEEGHVGAGREADSGMLLDRQDAELDEVVAAAARSELRPGAVLVPRDAADTIVSGVESGSIVTSVLAAPFRPAGGTTAAYVPVLIEVDGASLLANQTGDVAPTEIYAYALDGAGSVRDFFSQNLGLDLLKVGPQVQKSGLKFFGHLDLPPGDYSLRVLVRNGKTGAYSLRVAAVRVPSFAQPGPFLLPPFFPEPPGRWLMTREAARGAAAGGGAADVPYPFMMREQPYIPASRPVMGAGQDAQLSLVAYNLGEGEITASAQVLGADGKALQPADLQLTDRERGGAAAPDRLTASFRAPQLSPGEYRLQVTLTAGGGAPQTSSIPFVVAAAAAAKSGR
jgi:hypothetical protein